MPALPITFACGLYDRMLALHTGDVKPHGIDLNFVVLDNPREIFDRMTGRLEFDVCEMSSSEYISRFAAQKLPFVALPVFASRVFRHGFIVVNRRRVNAAKELAGKRIGGRAGSDFALHRSVLVRRSERLVNDPQLSQLGPGRILLVHSI